MSPMKNTVDKFAINPLLSNVPISYLWFSGVFRGYKMGALSLKLLFSNVCQQYVDLKESIYKIP